MLRITECGRLIDLYRLGWWFDCSIQLMVVVWLLYTTDGGGLIALYNWWWWFDFSAYRVCLLD